MMIKDPPAPPDPGVSAIPRALRAAQLWRVVRMTLHVLLPLALMWLVWHDLQSVNIHQLRGELRGADRQLLLCGILVTLTAVAVMGLYDAFAFPRGANGSLSFTRRWLLGSCLFGWTNFLSMGPLGGPALRVLAYRHYGLNRVEISRGFLGHYCGSSAGLLGWLIAMWLPAAWTPLGFGWRIALACVLSVAIAELAGRAAVRLAARYLAEEPREAMPMGRLGMVSFWDWGLTFVAFDLLIRSVGVELPHIGAARTMLTGHLAGLLSMLPGGVGTADAVWFKGFALMKVPYHAAAAGVLMFRGVFYLLPFLGAFVALYVLLAINSERVRTWQRRIVAGAVMLNAVLLLASAATPGIRPRLKLIAELVPLGAIELSHATATVAAVIMLFLVRGLLRGYRGAYLATAGLLGASVIAHPLKGGDFEEAIAAALLLSMLIGVRKAFQRSGRIPLGWEYGVAAAVASMAFFLVVGLSAFHNIPYEPALWTTFDAGAEASRFLRGSVLVLTVIIAFTLRQSLRPAHQRLVPSEADITRAETFIRAHADSADLLLVGGGDKGVWFWEDPPGRLAGLILHQRYGDKLVVFKEPVLLAGVDPAAVLSAYLNLADQLDVDVMFSMVSGRWMERLHDFGFHFLKVNEEAIVPLDGFSLHGKRSAGFRRTLRAMEQAGIRYERMLPPFEPATIDALRAVSDAWLESKGGHELQFSACYFSPRYIQRNPLAVARAGDGRIIGFVNLLLTRPGGPATIDFMRYVPDAAPNLMEFLIVNTMQALREEGYSSLSLGGAPLSDVGTWKSSRLVERALRIFSIRAERFYNYQGLLNYKRKFHPEWHPRYLAYQQPWEWMSSLTANARLVRARGLADRRRIAAARFDRDGLPHAPGGGS